MGKTEKTISSSICMYSNCMLYEYACAHVCIYNECVHAQERDREREREKETLRRFIRILMLSSELTYRIITAEFDRSNNTAPKN